MIKQLWTNKGWEFQFFGANIDAFSEAQNIRISRDQADNWDANGIDVMIKKMADRAKEARGGNLITSCAGSDTKIFFVFHYFGKAFRIVS